MRIKEMCKKRLFAKASREQIAAIVVTPTALVYAIRKQANWWILNIV